MFDNFINYCFPSSDISNDEEVITPLPTTTTTTTNLTVSSDKHIEIECKEFLPEVYDTWTFIHKLSTDSTRFREIYDLYKYERSERQQRDYFDQLKILDETIYKLSLTIHQRIQTLETIAQPALEEFRRSTLTVQQTNQYIPAYIRIAQNQLNSLKLSFKRIITQHNLDSIHYQNDLKESLRNSKPIVDSYQQISRVTIDKIKSLFSIDEANTGGMPFVSQEQIQLQEKQENFTEQETEIADLEARLESVRILKERVRQMNEMTMALYFSVQEQNERADNIWLNTSAGSDYIAQSVDEFRLVKTLNQSKRNLWMKLICITFCFLLILILILTLTLILNQK